jgi:hypothetical protein
MISVAELNDRIEEIGIQNFDYIEEEGTEDDAYEMVNEFGNAYSFGLFNGKFKDDTWKWWESYRIDKSYLNEGHFNVVFVGYGPAYELQ